MNRMLARALVRLYPRKWRERYGAEFAAMLEDRPGGVGAVFDVMGSALGERAFPTMGGKMAETSRWVDWSKQAPWALFGAVPLVVLAAAYFVALMILWSGWRIFLPAARTPFVPIDGWAIAYFGIGRLLYFFAPMLVGLGVAWAATRARVKPVWPLLGMALIAWVDGMAQVHTRWPTAGASGRVWMTLELGHLGYAPELLAISVLVYMLLWVRQKRAQAA
jgi:hypothetical protein